MELGVHKTARGARKVGSAAGGGRTSRKLTQVPSARSLIATTHSFPEEPWKVGVNLLKQLATSTAAYAGKSHLCGTLRSQV